MSRYLEPRRSPVRSWSAISSRAGLRPASELLASWIAPDRPNSITLSRSLADRRPAREPARKLVHELDSVMEFDFKWLIAMSVNVVDSVRFYFIYYRDI